MPRGARQAVVVGANWYQFRPDECLLNPHVMSVSFVWVVRGGGVIAAGGKSFRVGPNHTIPLPWHHRVEYQADAHNPFRVGTLHIVPEHEIGVPVEPRVTHLAGDPLLDDPARSDDSKQFLADMASFASGPARRIADLGAFAVERFTDAPFSEETSRALAQLVLIENGLWADSQPNPAHPPGLEAMMAYARTNIGSTMSVFEVARAGGCSATTPVTVTVTADPGTLDPEPAIADCRIDGGESGTGSRNVATVLSGVTPRFADACEPFTDPSVVKTTVGVPTQDATTSVWSLQYELTISNRSTTTTGTIPYTVTDTLDLPADVEIVGITTTAPAGGTVSPTFDGVADTALGVGANSWSGALIAAASLLVLGLLFLSWPVDVDAAPAARLRSRRGRPTCCESFPRYSRWKGIHTVSATERKAPPAHQSQKAGRDLARLNPRAERPTGTGVPREWHERTLLRRTR